MGHKSHKSFDWDAILSLNEGIEVDEKESKVGYPSMYQVVILEDDRTPEDFLIETLSDCFFLDETESLELLHSPSEEGKVSCGLYTRDAAETKVMQVIHSARSHNYPLRCLMQKENGDAITKS